MKALLRRLGFGPKPKLYVVTSHDQPEFKELLDEYWIPTGGTLAFRETAEAARATEVAPERYEEPDTSRIPLRWAAIHSKTSYYRYYEKMLEFYPKGRTPPPGLGEPPARPSFDKPALVLHEHEAEDPARRDGAGFTVCSGEVCLPSPLRAGIASELRANPRKRLIVIGFPVAPFDLPQSRQMEPNSKIDARKWVFETDTVEIKVF